MITLDEFITKYTGKFVEYHSYGTGAVNQCVDLCNQYIVECLGLPAIIGTNAQDFPSKAGSNYDYILNTPTGIPSKGDLVIFKSADNVGHISIFIEGTATKFTSFDQNYPTGSPCKQVGHYYTNVLGWMKPKKANMTTELEACMADRAKFWKERDEARAELTDVLQASKELVAENEELRNDLSTQGETLRKTITEKESLVDELNSHVLELAKKDDEIKLLTLKLNSIPQTPEISPTLSNVIALFRLWLKGWLRNGS